jgi:hypothetical protein
MTNINQLSTNQLVSYYMMSSYIYYVANSFLESPLSDTEYDELCKRLLSEWDDVDHPHKKLIDFNSLTAGTGFYLNDYPTIVKNAAVDWVESCNAV